MFDTSVDNLPDSLQGDTITPEVSGIFSNTFGGDKFGVAISASYQERDFGFNQASVGNGWKTFAGDENNWGTIPQPGTPGSERAINRPDATDTYSVPQNLGYSVNGVERKRTNGQLTLQYAPTDTITTSIAMIRCISILRYTFFYLKPRSSSSFGASMFFSKNSCQIFAHGRSSISGTRY